MSLMYHDTVIAGTPVIDNTPTAGSNHAVSSGGVKSALDAKADATALAGLRPTLLAEQAVTDTETQYSFSSSVNLSEYSFLIITGVIGNSTPIAHGSVFVSVPWLLASSNNFATVYGLTYGNPMKTNTIETSGFSNTSFKAVYSGSLGSGVNKKVFIWGIK